MIVSPLKPDTWYGETVGIVYGFHGQLSCKLKHLLSPQIIAFVIWQILLFYILLVRFSRCLKNRKNRIRTVDIAYFIFIFYCSRGFEPI
jgi:hypothetical protein